MVTRECVKQGWNPKIIFTPNGNGVQDKAYYEALGKYADGALASTMYYNPKAPDTDSIIKRFEADYPNQWLDANSGCAFEAVQIVADAVVRANSSASADIHAALKKTDMTPIVMNSGKIKFDENGQNINRHRHNTTGAKGKAASYCAARYRRREHSVSGPAIRGSLMALLWANVVLSGVLMGLVYGLIALGLTIIFGVIRVVNFAHGAMVVFGLYIGILDRTLVGHAHDRSCPNCGRF